MFSHDTRVSRVNPSFHVHLHDLKFEPLTWRSSSKNLSHCFSPLYILVNLRYISISSSHILIKQSAKWRHMTITTRVAFEVSLGKVVSHWFSGGMTSPTTSPRVWPSTCAARSWSREVAHPCFSFSFSLASLLIFRSLPFSYTSGLRVAWGLALANAGAGIRTLESTRALARSQGESCTHI